MKEIGGYFELELPVGNADFLHSDGIMLNSGRNALKFILNNIKGVNKVWVPDYTCFSIRKVMDDLGMCYEIYPVDETLQLKYLPVLSDNEYIIINNYFGIKDEYVAKIRLHYGSQSIIDNTQAWYDNVSDMCFYSPRKFFGLPDGGIAYVGNNIDIQIEQDYSFERSGHLLKRLDGLTGNGYEDYKKHSLEFCDMPIRHMSRMTHRLLESIDYSKVKEIRRGNYEILHDALKNTNQLELPSSDSFECAMCYPFFVDDAGLRKYLIDNKIFIPTYWEGIVKNPESGSSAKKLTESILPLPIDQRYGKEEMKYIIKTIQSWMCR